MEIIHTEIESKISLKPKICADSWFWTSVAINPYRGCQFNCYYCDGKANFYKIPDFGSNIRIKLHPVENIIQSLRKLGFYRKNDPKSQNLWKFVEKKDNSNLKKTPPKFIISVGGGVTDAYQPIEKEKEITRKILRVLIDFEFPAFLLTKSTLILRDIDLIGELNDRIYAGVNISVTASDENIRKKLEPHSASTIKRFDVLKKFRNANIPGGISMMPLAPFITDSEENITKLLQLASNSKAEHALVAGLTLKPGNRELFFEECLKKYFPQYLKEYKILYPENNTFGVPKFNKLKISNVTAIGHKLCKKYEISPRIKRYIPEGSISKNLLVAEHLHYLHYLFYWVGKNNPTKISNSMFPKLACEIESFHKDISNLSPEDRRKELVYPENLHKVIDEFLENGDSTLRKEND